MLPAPFYLINLARRPDRLAQMVTQFEALGLRFERVEAVDSEAISTTELAAEFAPRGPLGPFHRGPQCCTLSHLRTYRRFLSTGKPYAVVLEDDARLSPEMPRFLENLAWFPTAAGIVKVERFGPEHQHVLVERAISIGGDREVARLWSKHTGSAAYIISRNAAARVLDRKERINMDIDQLLFNPDVSPLFRTLDVYQMIPALVVQKRDATDRSDVAARRTQPCGLASIERKILRAANGLRALPHQVLKVMTGEARLVKVGYR